MHSAAWDDIAEECERLRGRAERAERERDEAVERAEQSERRYPATIAHMHDAVARAERAEGVARANDEQRAAVVTEMLHEQRRSDGFRERAERAEAARDAMAVELMASKIAQTPTGHETLVEEIGAQLATIRKLEATIAKVRVMIGDPGGVSYAKAECLAYDVIDILDGKEGA